MRESQEFRAGPMGLMDNTLHFYPVAKPARDKWSATRTAWFVLIAGGLLWGGIIALVWRIL